MDQTFDQLDDLVLHLKGLVLVRKYREQHQCAKCCPR